MKKWNLAIAASLFLLIVSCSEDEDPFKLPDDIYTITKVYDIGNNNSSADIRVHLNFDKSVNVSDLEEARLVIVKGAQELTVDQAKSLSPESFFTFPISSSVVQIIKPTTGLDDSDGNLVTSGNYKAYVVALGIGNSIQLSAAKEFTLSAKPVFSGDYIGTWEDLGPPGPAKFPMSLRISDNYMGKMYYANATFTPFGSGTQDALTSMTVDGTTISSFVLDQLIGGYMGGCAANETLTGSFNDDIELVLDTFSWADCDGTRDVKLKFTRQ